MARKITGVLAVKGTRYFHYPRKKDFEKNKEFIFKAGWRVATPEQAKAYFESKGFEVKEVIQDEEE